MSASLVGSEMCIRDSFLVAGLLSTSLARRWRGSYRQVPCIGSPRLAFCLLYTSDAATICSV
eukprot:11310906-Alexandrium_andersonii.AAC.1